MRVVAVVVTYNRLPLLLKCLMAIEAQTRPVDAILVIDNASSDVTRTAVQQNHPRAEIHSLSSNIGGAGGFAYGIDAVRRYADKVWLMDDDAAPHPDALARLLAAQDRHPGAPPTLVASRVIDHDGHPIPMNVPRPRPFARKAAREAAGAAGCVPIRSASFVSVLLDAAACRNHELPIADYFIWNDDFEYTARLLRHGVGLWCPASVVEHAVDAGAGPGARFGYEVRNKLWLLTRSNALSPLERLLYGGATFRRWIAMIAASDQPSLLLRHLTASIYRAARSGPRPTAEILEQVKATTDQTSQTFAVR
ncbi:MAG TPA: glycosyltransferase family 2 protein [Mycobacteriales bacterium]|nr:glycosyltransferase family 2 protein [Mycobacteriales bacterium]